MTRTLVSDDLRRHLWDVEYPTDRNQLFQAARRNGADSDAFERILALPDQPFHGPQDVMAAFERIQ